MRPSRTESESDGDGDGDESKDNNDEESQSFQSDDSVSYGIPIPSSYLLTSPSAASSSTRSRSSPSSSINNNKNNAKRKGKSCLPMPTSPAEQRLLMMAKHPGMSVSSEETVYPFVRDDEQPSTTTTTATTITAASKSNKNNTSVNFDAAGPIDADTGNAWVASDNSETVVPWEAPPESASSSSSNPTTRSGTSRWDRLVAWFYYRPLNARENNGGGGDVYYQDCAASKQSMSVVSDQTPRVSNVSLQKKRKVAAAAAAAAKVAHHNDNNNDNNDNNNSSSNTSTITTLKAWCKRILSTRSGIVVLCLVVVLFLAIIVTVSAAVASSNNNNNNKQDKTGSNSVVGEEPPTPRIIPGPMVPRAPTATTLAPTSAPTIDLLLVSPPPIQPFPSVSPTTTTTASPTTSSPTLTPTKSPTFSPTLPGATRAPTPPPTRRPTRLPTPLPTPRPTLRPTPGPTARPTRAPTPNPTPRPTRPPTFSPTLRPTTRPPTLSPTTQFDGLLLQPLEALMGAQGLQERFGYSIALSQDGTILAVGAPWATIDGKLTAGMVQVYQQRNSNGGGGGGGGWDTRGPAVVGQNAGDQFGSSVSLSSDGSVLAVGAPTYTGVGNKNRSGNVRVFVHGPANRYELLGSDIAGLAATDHFGVAVALSPNGRRVAIGAPYHDNGTGRNRLVSGQLQVYELDDDNDNAATAAGSQWNVIASFQGTDHLDWFGWSVDIVNADSRNGAESSVVCAGAPRNLEYGGYVTCYTDRGGTWQQLGNKALRNNIEPVRYDDSWGNALSISQDGNRVAIGSPGKNGALGGVLNTGMVAVYDYDVASNNWNLLGGPGALTLQHAPSNNQDSSFQFGSSLDLVGSVLAVGSPGLGQVDLYEFQSHSGQWQRHSQSWKSSDDNGSDGGADSTNSDYGYAVQLSPTYTLAVASAAMDGSQPGRVNVYKP